MKVKVCGMRDAQNIREVSELHPDYMGFIFYPRSKRYAGGIEVHILDQIPSSIKRTGVFVDESPGIILKTAGTYKLQAIQLHGNEDPDICKALKNSGMEVIKAFGIDEAFNFDILKAYADSVDYFLFDTKTSGYGGSGKTFNWKELDKYKWDIPYFLSGGLNPANIGRLSGVTDQRFYAADLNSGFEISPAMKNITELKKAINLLKHE